MKINIIKSIAWVGLFSVSVSSCDLDVIPPDSMTSESFWKTEKDAWYALNEIYARMPDFIDGMSYEMYTDNAHSHKPWEGAWEAFQQGGITAGQSSGYDYSVIRLVNDFLEKADNCEMDDNLRKRMKAEARFFRAWAYQEMIVKFGGVPLVTTVLAYDAPNVKRDDIETVRTFILTELQEVADILPDSYDGGEMYETGRVSRAAALALRARAALYGGNYPEAEASASAVINEGHHSLFKVTELNSAQQQEADEMEQWVDFNTLGIDKTNFMKGIFSYEGIWQDDNGAVRNNPEVLLSHEHMYDSNVTDLARYQYARPSQLVRGYSSYEPLPDLVQAYWKSDGKTLPDKVDPDTDASNYAALYAKVQNNGSSISQQEYIEKVPTLDLKSEAYIQQFRNRDSRLYASILLPFKGWHVTDFGTFYYRWFPEKAGSEDGNESWTGFSWRKLVALRGYDSGSENYSYDDFPVLRYAEVLLTAAEAHVQNTGYDATVTGWLNQLRERCGMPDVPASFASKNEALNFIRNERRIELAGEGQRFADMRRYGNDYCKQVMTGPSYAPGSPGGGKYTIVDKQWNDRGMLLPIPTSAMDYNPLLEQNPGY